MLPQSLFALCLLFIVNTTFANHKTIKPPRLKPGDTVELLAPGFQTNPENLRFAVERMHALGLKVLYPQDVLNQHGYFSGTIQQRAKQLNKAIKNPKIKAIHSNRRPNNDHSRRESQGEIIGGNLTVLTRLMGTKDVPKNWKGKNLFIEDMDEGYYQIDRKLFELESAGVLSQLSGFIMGTCVECQSKIFHGFRLDQILDHYIKPLNIPAYSGAAIGHQAKIFTLPEGLQVEMDADKGTIKMLEPAVK